MITFAGYFTYNDNYSEENYEYEDVEERKEANFVPVFQSSPTVYRIQRGDTARLECKVDRLGPMVLSWKKLKGNGSECIVNGSKVMTDISRRVSVRTSSSVSTLIVRKVRPIDTGEYQCEVSSTPPVHLTHELKIRTRPSVMILGENRISLKEGEELALVCKVRIFLIRLERVIV